MIRRKFLVVPLGLLTFIAISSGAITSASAVVFTLSTTECTGGTGVGLCWSELEAESSPLLELTGKQSETVSGGKTILKVASVSIECLTATGAGTINQEGPLTGGKTTITGGTITYKGCVITGPAAPAAKCAIPEEKSTATISAELPNEHEIVLKPEAGTVFIEIPFTNKGAETCPAAIKGTHSVTGSVAVEILTPKAHQLTKVGKAQNPTKLEFFSEKAELTEELEMSFTGLEDFVDLSETM